MDDFTIQQTGPGRYEAFAPNGGRLGFATWSLSLHDLPLPAGRRFLDVQVHPDCRGRGAGTALADAVITAARQDGAQSLACSVAPDDPAGLEFARRLGFRVDYQMIDGELDLAHCDPAPWAGAVPAAEANGIRFTSLLQAQEVSGVLEKLYALDERLSYDVPEWSGVMPPFADYCASLLAGDPAGVIIAWAGIGPVGYSVTKAEDDGTGYTEFLGVLRAWRGKGVALALKLLTIRWALDRGLTRLMTNNNASSESILSLNRKLGYRLLPGPIYLVREA